MRIYKVPLYSVSYDINNYGRLDIVDSIIVKTKLVGVSEVLTGFSDITVVSRDCICDNKLDKKYLSVDRHKKKGYHFIIHGEDLNLENSVFVKDIDLYVESYSSSKWKEEYERIKQFSESNKKARQRVKEIFKTMK